MCFNFILLSVEFTLSNLYLYILYAIHNVLVAFFFRLDMYEVDITSFFFFG